MDSLSTTEMAYVLQIAERAEHWYILADIEDRDARPMLSAMSDVAFVHTEVCPLLLTQLVKAPLPDFVREVVGFRNYLDREHKCLRPGFEPRYAA